MDANDLITSGRSIQTAYGEQDENGTDLSLIRELLKMPPLARLRQMDQATSETLRLRQHARRTQDKSA